VTARVNRAGKRVAAAIVIAMVGMTALVFVAPAASAADTAKFCAANDKLQSKLDNLNNGKSFNPSDFKSAGSAFKAAAKSAPKKVKSAMGTIGSFLSSLGSGNAADYAKALAGSGGKNYGKAIATWSTYVATNCT
jgi:hypothetical protein